MGLEVNISKNDMGDILKKLKTSFNRTTELTALEVWGNVKEYSPVDHGRLQGSWVLSQNLGDKSYTVGTSVVYAMVQNDGCDPFMIYPKNKKALRFKINGEWIFAKRVRHPGIKGKKYIDRAIDDAESRLDDFIYHGLNEEGLV